MNVRIATIASRMFATPAATPLLRCAGAVITGCFLLTVALPCAVAAPTQIGAWLVSPTDSSDGVTIAAYTVNGDGRVLGRWCSGPETCHWIYASRTRCATGGAIGLLANTNDGSMALNTHCAGSIRLLNVDYYRNVFDDSAVIEAELRNARSVSFAIPLADGDHFLVSRFNLEGMITTLSVQNQELGALGAGTRNFTPRSVPHGSRTNVSRDGVI